jgi:hypothetical protein
VTDAWHPQVNGVVQTWTYMRRELDALGMAVTVIGPQSPSLPVPGEPGLRLALRPGRQVRQALEALERAGRADDFALHIATEGPLGWSARRHATRRGMTFTTAYHTRFPEYLRPRFGVPLDWSYALLRRFHAPASNVMAPTPSIVDALKARGFANAVLWSRGVDLELFAPRPLSGAPADGPDLPRPIFLYAGRVAVEKNLEAFLDLDLPGSKLIVGDGPRRAALQRRHCGPRICWAGAQPPDEIARFYRAADVFVFPSLTDTFGLVMLEALACGLPVAAFDVPGPRDVIGGSDAGAIGPDLRVSCLRALEIPRARARAHAERFSWGAAARQFAGHLRPVSCAS